MFLHIVYPKNSATTLCIHIEYDYQDMFCFISSSSLAERFFDLLAFSSKSVSENCPVTNIFKELIYEDIKI